MKNLTKLEQQTLGNIDEERNFQSNTWGKLTFKELIYHMGTFMLDDVDATYNVIIGSDSQRYNGHVAFVSAIVVHRVGGGAIYFWDKEVSHDPKLTIFENRMFEEAVRSISVAQQFMEEFKIEGITKYDVEIHVDVGSKGKTRALISSVVGMIEGNGFVAKTKPQAYGAASVADRHT